jgi:hypothetical protein
MAGVVPALLLLLAAWPIENHATALEPPIFGTTACGLSIAEAISSNACQTLRSDMQWVVNLFGGHRRSPPSPEAPPSKAGMAGVSKVTTKSFYDLTRKELKTRYEAKLSDSDIKVRAAAAAAAAARADREMQFKSAAEAALHCTAQLARPSCALIQICGCAGPDAAGAACVRSRTAAASHRAPSDALPPSLPSPPPLSRRSA